MLVYLGAKYVFICSCHFHTHTHLNAHNYDIAWQYFFHIQMSIHMYVYLRINVFSFIEVCICLAECDKLMCAPKRNFLFCLVRHGYKRHSVLGFVFLRIKFECTSVCKLFRMATEGHFMVFIIDPHFLVWAYFAIITVSLIFLYPVVFFFFFFFLGEHICTHLGLVSDRCFTFL